MMRRARNISLQLRRGFSSRAAPPPLVSDSNPVLVRSVWNDAEIYLIGTVHGSQASARAVSELMRVVRPNEVYVELDSERARRLRQRENERSGHNDAFLKAIIDGMDNMQRNFTAFARSVNMPQEHVGMSQKAMKLILEKLKQVSALPSPGIDFLQAMKEADQIEGCELIYFDRDQSTTLRELLHAAVKDFDVRKILQKMSKLLSESERGAGLSQEVERIVTGSKTTEPPSRPVVRTICETLREDFPHCAKAILDDRDQIMAEYLRSARGRVVAVVGMAHMDGIERACKQLETERISAARADPHLEE